jgi:vanillate/3-O-methylgallate O-demethylase
LGDRSAVPSARELLHSSEVPTPRQRSNRASQENDVTNQTSPTSLQGLLDSLPSVVDHLYSNRKGSVLKDAVLRQPTQFVAPEFTNWREEQLACRTSIAFYDQSFHMTTTFIRGKDAVPLMNHLCANSFGTFGVDRSRHTVMCSPEGYLIGDGILYCLAPDELALVGRQAGHNWVRFNAQTGGWDVELEEDEFMADNPNGRRTFYRFQVEGPHAPALMEQLTGAEMPKVPKLHLMHITIAGHEVTAMQHTMAGNPGWELFGPWDDGPAVKEAILSAGEAFDMKRVGSVAYFTTAMELGWVSRPMPAIFTAPEMKAFREWLPPTAPEATWGLGGSYNAPNIEDYYFTPWELGYGNVVKLDKGDFVGSDALKKSVDNDHRQKVSLVWNPEDVAKIIEGYMQPGELPPMYLEFPRANYATWLYDTVLDADGNHIGISTYPTFLWTERAMCTLGILDAKYATPGTEVTFVWGEPESRTSKYLEPHRQMKIRATVEVAPIGKK